MIAALLDSGAMWAALGAVVVALLGLLGISIRNGGKEAGRREAAEDKAARDREQARRVEEVVKERMNAEQDAARLPDGGAADRLRERWSRD